MNNKECESIAYLLSQHKPLNYHQYFLLDERIKKHFNTIEEIQEENSLITDYFDKKMRNEYGYDYANYFLSNKNPTFILARKFLRESICEVLPSLEDAEVEEKLELLKQTSNFVLFLKD